MGKPGEYGGKGKPYQGQQGATWSGAQSRLHEPDVAPGVPTWDGDPDTFQAFEQAAAWYVSGLKDNEKKLAAARVWSNLRGSARLAVGRLLAKDYEREDGLGRLLEYLRKTPLAKQPLPDAYRRIGQYRGIKRFRGDTAAQYVLREQEAYDRMLESLRKLRQQDSRRERQRQRRRIRREKRNEDRTRTDGRPRSGLLRYRLQTSSASKEAASPNRAPMQVRTSSETRFVAINCSGMLVFHSTRSKLYGLTRRMQPILL